MKESTLKYINRKVLLAIIILQFTALVIFMYCINYPIDTERNYAFTIMALSFLIEYGWKFIKRGFIKIENEEEQEISISQRVDSLDLANLDISRRYED